MGWNALDIVFYSGDMCEIEIKNNKNTKKGRNSLIIFKIINSFLSPL